MKTLLKTAGKILLHLGAILLMSLVIFIIEGIVGIIIQTNAGWGGKDYFDDSVLGDISLGQLVIITVLILWITALIRRIRRPALRRINAATVALKIFLYLLAFFPVAFVVLIIEVIAAIIIDAGRGYDFSICRAAMVDLIYGHNVIIAIMIYGITALIRKLRKRRKACGKYGYVESFSEGLALVELNNKWGYIDKTGKEVIPVKYDDAWSFSQGLAPVKLTGKCGYIDKTGKEVIPVKYDDAWSFSQGLAPVKLTGKCGYIDKTGKEVIPFQYDGAGSFSQGLAPVKLNGKWGYIDKTGEEVIPFQYDGAGSFSQGLAPIKLTGKWGYIDKTGEEVIPFQYDDAGSFSKRPLRVQLNGKWGYIDKTGKTIIPLKYSDAGVLAAVQLNGKWGYIDKTGKEIIPFQNE